MPVTLNDNTIDMMDLRSQPGTVVDQVFYRNASFVIRRKGQPRAVIVPLGEYAAMQRRRQAAKEHLFALIDTVQARTAQYDPDEVQQAIDEAVDAVRKEKKKTR
jgi:PHD/YefM family antitoxin component YafN of YafNO toxin-antitoxin module